MDVQLNAAKSVICGNRDNIDTVRGRAALRCRWVNSAADHAIDGEFQGCTAFDGAVKHTAINKSTVVVGPDGICGPGCGATARIDDLVLQARGSDGNACCCGIGRQECLARVFC